MFGFRFGNGALSDGMVFTIGVWGIHYGLYWLANAFYWLLSHFQLLQHYRIQQSHQPPDALVRLAIVEKVFGTVIEFPVTLMFVYPIFAAMGMEIQTPVPGLLTFLWQVPLCQVLNEFGFYWVHRLLHTPLLYAFVHKKHHEFKTTVGFASEYVSVTEALVAGVLPASLPVLLLHCHFAVFLVVLLLHMICELDQHSGYCFPLPLSLGSLPWYLGFSSPEFHAWHHSHTVGNYGAPLFDYVFGTDKTFRAGQEQTLTLNRHLIEPTSPKLK